MESPKIAFEASEVHEEYVPSPEAIRSFLSIDEETHAKLGFRLKGAAGHARIWVHPLYTEQWPMTFTHDKGGVDELHATQEKLRSTFLKTTESVRNNEKSSPLFVYESVKKVHETKKIVAEHIGVAEADVRANRDCVSAYRS